jgi:hypothetical protein
MDIIENNSESESDEHWHHTLIGQWSGSSDIIENNSESESEYEINLEETNECLCYENDNKDTHMEFVKKLDKNSWNERTIQFAVEHGEWECVKYLYENGCPFNKDTIISTGVDNLEMLKYLHGIGGCLNNMHVITARLSDNYEVFEYLLDNGCEFDIELAKGYGIIFTKEDEGEEYIDDNGDVYKRRKVYDI